MPKPREAVPTPLVTPEAECIRHLIGAVESLAETLHVRVSVEPLLASARELLAGHPVPAPPPPPAPSPRSRSILTSSGYVYERVHE